MPDQLLYPRKSCVLHLFPALITLSSNQFYLFAAPTTHWNPETSQNGDAKTSGPNDPGLANLGKTDPVITPTGKSGALESLSRPAFSTLLLAAALLSTLL